MNSKVIYYRQYSFCDKAQCKKCREGRGHGPYWYAYRNEGGRITRTYIGRTLPPEALAAPELATIIGQPGLSALSKLYLLGTFRLERGSDEGRERTARSSGHGSLQPAARALLALLISQTARRLTRAEAQAALWPDLAADMAARRLERAIQSLRHWLLLPSGRPTAENKAAYAGLLDESGDSLILAGQEILWIDADSFEDLLAQAAASNDELLRENLLEEALRLYKGDLLIGWSTPPYPAALARRRSALRARWLEALFTLAHLRIARENFKGALPPLERLLSSEPSRQDALSLLMFCLARLRRRSEAIHLYQQFLTSSAQPPTAEMRALYQAISEHQALASPSLPGRSDEPGRRQEHSSAGGPPARPSPTIGRTHRSPLVGREQELAILRQLLTSIEQLAESQLLTSTASGSLVNHTGRSLTASPLDLQRRPQYIMLRAAPGLGKTRLAEEISREALQRNWTVIWSRVYEQESSIPYRLWIEPLRSIIAHERWQQQELQRRPAVYAPLGAILPELYEYLPQPASLPPEQEQQRLKEALQELLMHVSGELPLLLVLDDLHWADASSCELLGYLVRRLAGHRVMFLGTCRDSDLAANETLQTLIAHLHREHGVITLDLPPLTDEQIAQIISHVPEPTLRHIQRQAAGNPFFAEELARSLEVQLFTPTHEGRPVGLQRLPETITAVLDMRLSRLSRPCRRLLSDAAIFGGSFEFEALCALEAADPQPFDEERVLDLLDEALQAGVLSEASSGKRIIYHFWHPLLVSHLYESMSGMKRVLLHRRAAETLRQLYATHEEKGAATITYHLVAGGAGPEPIIHYASLAADAAYALSAYPEATRLYRIAIEQLTRLETETAGSPSSLPYDRRAYLLGRLAECIRIQGHYAEAGRLYQRALDVAQEGRDSSEADDPLYWAQLEARLLTEIGRTWFYMSDFARAHEYCDRAEERLRATGLSEGMAWAMLRYLRGYIYNEEGRYDEARHEGQEALRLYERLTTQTTGSPGNIAATSGARAAAPLISGDPIGLARTHRFLSTLDNNMGHHQQALNHLQIALTRAEQLGHKREIAHTCCNIGHVHLARAAHREARDYFRRSMELADEVGDLPLMAVLSSNLGILAEREGNLAEAERHLRQAIAQGEQGKDQVYLSYWHGYLARVLQAQGRLNEAGRALYKALTIARTIKSSPCLSSALVTLAHLRLAQVHALQAGLSEQGQSLTPGSLSRQLLQRAQASLRLALAQPGITAEVKARAALGQAFSALLLGDLQRAQQAAQEAFTQAGLFEMAWLEGQTHSVSGSILAAEGQTAAAIAAFEEALRTFRERGMRLDYARTLGEYARLLASWDTRGRAQARTLRAEAEQILNECGALFDLALLRSATARRL
jgi:tetratricopeptide (TPR) repeat protein